MTQEAEGAFVPSTDELYQWWWLHDAQWYQGVARRFGPEAANEINAEAVRFVAQRVARTVAKQLGRPIAELSWADVVDVFTRCPAKMWPPALAEYDYVITAPGEFEVFIRKSFAFAMLRLAGSLGTYRCPCVQMRAGWFDGLGLKAEQNRVTQCILEGAECCRLVATVSGYSVPGTTEEDATEEDATADGAAEGPG
jgi:hypothetical protein